MAGCARKCPCRKWAQCPAYVDMQEQARRIAGKEYDFVAWYDLYFRHGAEMGYIGNG